METTKFINAEMAMIAATEVFKAVQRTGHYAHLRGKVEWGKYEVDVQLEKDELLTLPTRLVYSEVKEDKYDFREYEIPAWKNRKYIFEF